MDVVFKRNLNHKIQQIQGKSSKTPLLVFKGFPHYLLEKVDLEKLVTLPVTIDLYRLHTEKPKLLQEVIMKTASNPGNALWCTFEEFLSIGAPILSMYFEVKVFKNNVYHQFYPCTYSVQKIEELYSEIFENDEFLNDDDFDHPSFSIFTEYYGGLKKVNNTFYITYASESEEDAFFTENPDAVSITEQSIYSEVNLELSEVEDDFLLLIEELLQDGRDHDTYNISFSGDLDVLPNRYKERISVLQFLLKEKVTLHLVTKSLDQKAQFDEKKYVDVLNRFWHFPSFRNLKMYKNINDPINNKEIIEIPQSQIIDDIVKQAENAKTGKSYKDIFVTSPTGAGKSIMFQIPAIYLAENYGHMTIVISPLIGLMKDQVEGMQRKDIDISATINSEITPVQKMDIIEKIKVGKIKILYISPETLLSRSDIKLLIGDQQIGLFVVDEAHIVTTWGKAFRSDYWYLGSYLNKLRKEMNKEGKGFPIATFTATAIYGGVEDMYSETRDSLNLINPISYFGYVKRDNLQVLIKQSKKEQGRFNEYLHDKFRIMLHRIENQFLPRGEKTLIYFPTVALIHKFRDHVRTNKSDLLNQLVMYYGPMAKEDKNESFAKYLKGEARVMLATKAFGMGIDIPDIANVYHFAPTGNVCDYVQEIGRAARDLEEGRAFFDYLSKDFVHVNRLHGVSTIRKHQLIQVMEKILLILDQNKDKSHARNLLVSAEDFRYIFEKKSANNDQDEDIDNKLKTALLIIEKDFIAKLNYSPIVARPRSIFAKEYFMFEKKNEVEILRKYGSYFTIARERNTGSNNIFGNIYIGDLKKLWEDKYEHLSFPNFKRLFHQKDEKLKLPILKDIMPVLQLELDLKEENSAKFLNALKRNVSKISEVFGVFVREGKYFTVPDFAKELQKATGKNKYFCENLASIIMQSADNYDQMQKKSSNFYTRFLKYYEERNAYVLTSGYAAFMDWIVSETSKLLADINTVKVSEDQYQTFLPKANDTRIEKLFVLLGMIEALGLLIYRVNGGDKPEIYIRINSRLQLDRTVKEPNRYNNVILQNVYKRHKISVEMLMFLFENEVDTEQFWNYIEDYFLGHIPQEVLARLAAKPS